VSRNAVRERILAAAMQLWAEKDYESATMRELARRVGMGASTLYQHFDSKEAIVLHFYQRLNEEVAAEFDAEGSTRDVGADLERYLRLKLARLGPHRSALTGLLREAVDPESRLSPLHPDSDGTLLGNVERFADWIEAAGLANDERAKDLGRLLWLLHMGVMVFWLHDRSDSAALTESLLVKVGSVGALIPMMGMLPQMNDVLALFRGLLDARSVVEVAQEQRPAVDREVDVVIAGGGPIGCLCAAFLKQMRPRTRVLVLEREPVPIHKVGESTLSGFCKALRTIGIRHDAMQVLFQLKNGLGFSWVDEGRRLEQAEEYVLETFDETFQVERRVMDALIIAQVRRLGVEVLQGATVDWGTSEIAADQCTIAYTVGRRTYRVGARWLVDATGPAASIARKQGLWTDDGTAFQTSAVWAYFEDVRTLSQRRLPGRTRFPRDEYTWHLCARPGWIWWIPQVSFADAPMSNLRQGIDAMLTAGRLPDLAALERMGMPVTSRVSAGLLVRSDRDDLGLATDPAAAFSAARRRWPCFDQLLEGATMVDDPTGDGRGPYGSRKNMRGHARRVAGDGWLAVGDAAFFVDPLISPGLTAGSATAWRAARDLATALDAGLREEAFSDFEGFTRTLHAALERDNQLVYHSFDHPDLLALVQRFQEITARQHFLDGEGEGYCEVDTDVWGILQPSYAELQQEMLALLQRHASEVDGRIPVAEQTNDDYAPVVAALRERFGAHLSEHEELTPYVAANREQ
jgi:flavin-dependent dehydrogenase/AcrR family transcriptional regulator